MAMRILAMTAAAFLVGAFTLAVSLPLDLSLGEALARLDGPALSEMQFFLRAHADWAWHWLAGPLLAHPVWFSPAASGVILGGVSAHLAVREGEQRSRGKN